MKLNLHELQNREVWLSKGYRLPGFDPIQVREHTLQDPVWIHFGAGNIFRVFPAVLQQRLLDEGLTGRGIVVSEAYDEEILDKAYAPFDNLSLMVTLNPDGNIDKQVVASVVQAVKPSEDMDALVRIFTSPSLQMVSFTITEKGYAVKGGDGRFFRWIEPDLSVIPDQPNSLVSLLTLLMLRRHLAGDLPVALVSMDNCAHNGTRLFDAVMTFATAWLEKGLVGQAFLDYLNDPAKVSFTWSMIDKITPRPSASVQKMLEADGYESAELIVTSKNTYTASFVNAEPTQYLVIEDWFPNGRPPLEKAGVLFTDRETVDKVETMKVCTCLNPLHTVLAVFGSLFRYRTISETVGDPLLKRFIERVGYDEGMPVVVNPGIIQPEDFIRTVIEERFPNPFLPDTPQRIATDTSQKIPVRFGETLKAYQKRGAQPLSELTCIPLFIAGWFRYLLGIDDQGNPMELSPDPMLEELQEKLAGITLGAERYDDTIRPILSDPQLFGIDLTGTGLDGKVYGYFHDMTAGPGAVRKTIEKVLS